MTRTKWLLAIFLISSFILKVVFVPVFMALFLAMLLDPFVRAFSSRGISRAISSVLVILCFGCFAAILGWLAYTAGIELMSALPTYAEKANLLMAKVSTLSKQFTLNPGVNGRAPVVQLAPSQVPEWTHVVFTGLGPLYETLSICIFVPMLMFYFLVDKENLLESFNVITGKYFNLPKLNQDLPRMLRVFFAANLVTGLFLVLAQGILFVLMGYENWISLALLTGFFNLMPIVGGGLAIAAPLILGLGVPLTLTVVFGLCAAMLALHFLANNLVMPLLVGSRLNMNPVALIVGLLFWSWMWGVAGFFLAVPMTALFKILLECNKETVVIANLMASKPTRVIAGPALPSENAGSVPQLIEV